MTGTPAEKYVYEFKESGSGIKAFFDVEILCRFRSGIAAKIVTEFDLVSE